MKFNDTNKSRADIERDIQLLREWLSKMPHLPNNIDEDLLSAFIYGTKSIECAKKKIDSFCTAREKFPETFGFPFRDPLNAEFQESCKFTKMMYLPNPTPEGYRVFMISGFDGDKFHNDLYNTRIIMMVELALVLWPTMRGIIIVIDTIGSNASIIPKITIGHNMSDARYYQAAMPVKVKKLIVINATPVVEFIINSVIKRVFPKKISDRFEVKVEDEKILEQYFPLDLLPKDYYGGTAPSAEELNEQCRILLEERREWFLQTSKLRSDETKRPSESQNNFGIDGTFKYLVID